MVINKNKPFYDILAEERIELEFNTIDDYKENIKNTYNGRIRVYDGEEWHMFHYENISLESLKSEANKLISNYEIKNKNNILEYKKIIGNENITHNDFPLTIYKQKKVIEKILFLKSLRNFIPLDFDLYYHDVYTKKTFITDNVYRTYNFISYGIGIKINAKKNAESDFYTKTYHTFDELINCKDEIINYCNEYKESKKSKKQIKEGKYPVILSPEVTGILVHECFGHIFEADVRYEDDIGERLTNNSDLSIYDNGKLHKLGYCPFDDDGIINTNTQIIRNGKINGYLSDIQTALNLGIIPSGNGRSVKLSQKTISRMTNTYLAPTQTAKEELFKSINGIYIIIAKYGEIDSNGNLVIIPLICRIVENGIIGDYIKVNKLYLDINDVFSSIEMIGNDLEFNSTLFGGCGKMNQYPLLISQGGPHILMNEVNCS